MGYSFTAARKAALRKAQMISARKRKGHYRAGAKTPKRKLSPGHKRAIKVAVAGSVLAGGTVGAFVAYERSYRHLSKNRQKHLAKPPGSDNTPDATKRRVSHHGDLIVAEMAKSVAVASREVHLTRQNKVHTKVTHPLAKSIMQELDGKPVKGYYDGIRTRGKYKTVFGEGVSGSHG